MTQTGAPAYQRFLAELKRRKVFRVMAVYGVVGFVLLQVVDLAVPALLLPEWTYRLVALLLLIGLPIAVVLAWAFELTPDGLQKTERADPGEITQIVSAPATRRWPVGFAAAGATALLLFTAWFVLGRPGAGGGQAGADGRGADGGARARASIAVLPFGNLSGDDDTQPFADGLHDDLLTQLSKIGALTVISRTSVLEYRDSPKKIGEIADELGVATVLEGGVQRSGGRYRINVQLIDADTDAHLWAEQFDGELTAENIFDVQTRIATAIADALEANLAAGERENLERIPTRDLEAHELYREARELASFGYREREFRTAERTIDLALERDPAFAEAWAIKSIIASYQYWFFFDRSDSIVAAADSFARRALALAPGLAEGNWARAHYWYRTKLDYERANEALALAMRARPGDNEFVGLAGDILRRKGDTRGALRHYQRVVVLNPRDVQGYLTLAETHQLLREFPEAEAAGRRAVELRPGHQAIYPRLAFISVVGSGDTAEARAWLREAEALGVYDPDAEFGQFQLAMLERDPAGALSALGVDGAAAVSENQFAYVPRPLASGLARRLSGDSTAARAAFDSARAVLEPLVAADPTEPRYRSALGLALAGLGRSEDAIREGEEGLRLMPPEREAWRGAWRLEDLARIHAMTGGVDQAIAALERLIAMPSDVSAWTLRLDPAWDPLRGDPRFEALAAGTQAPRPSLPGSRPRGDSRP